MDDDQYRLEGGSFEFSADGYVSLACSVPQALLTVHPGDPVQREPARIHFAPMYSLRFPEGGALAVDGDSFLITGLFEFLDDQGNVVARFGSAEQSSTPQGKDGD